MIKQLSPTNLFSVEVAPDASNYRFGDYVFGEKIYPNDLCYDTEENVWNLGNAILHEGNYKILGEVIKDKRGFDISKLKEVALTIQESNSLLGKNDKIDFYKLLADNGLYFVNNHYKPEDVLLSIEYMPFDSPLAHTMRKEWQLFEDKLIKGKLLIIEKI